MSNIIGWLALATIFLAYLFLNTRFTRTFMVINIIGCFLFSLHAFLIKDVPFLILNSFIGLMWLIKLFKS